MSGLIQSFFNRVRDEVISPQEKERRENLKKGFEMTKVASIILVIATGFFCAVFPSGLTLFALSLNFLVAFEVFQMAENGLEILNNAAVALKVGVSREAFIDQIAKNTLLSKPVLQLALPSEFKLL